MKGLRTGAALVVALGLLALAPVSASAGGVYSTAGTMTYIADPGENNNVTIDPHVHQIRDSGAPIYVLDAPGGSSCSAQPDGHSAVCFFRDSVVLHLGDGDDTAIGLATPGTFEVFGGPGDDILLTELVTPVDWIGLNRSADVRLHGGDGNDRMRARTVVGDDGDDVIEWAYVADGGDGDDSITAVGPKGGAGNDTIWAVGAADGGAGNDLITGYGGPIDGGAGDDTLRAGQSDATFDMAGGAGSDDVLQIGTGKASGGDGNDVVAHNGGGDAHGDDGNDTVTASAGSAFGDAGDDVVSLRSGHDRSRPATRASPTCGNGLLEAFRGIDDVADGGPGADVVAGTPANDLLRGGDGPDQLLGGAGSDDLDGGAGIDTLDGGDNGDRLEGGDDGDALHGGDGRDTLLGESGADRLDGGDDADLLDGGAGNDVFDGGPGALDIACYFTHDAGVSVDLRTRGGDGLRNEDDEIAASVEQIGGTAHDDRITLDDHGRTVRAGDGDDVVLGGAGADDIEGGFDDDRISGAGGNDRVSGGAETVRGRANSNGVDLVDGGAGDDWVAGDRGVDRLTGGAGADTIVARENPNGTNQLLNHSPIIPLGHGDPVSCGPGLDEVLADYADAIAADCESGKEGTPRWRRQRVSSQGVFTLKVRCAWKASRPCTGTSSAIAAHPGTTAARGNATPASGAPKWCSGVRAPALATGRFKLRAGRVGTVTVALGRTANRLLKRRGCLPVRIVFRVKGPASSAHEASRTLTLLAPGFRPRR